MNVYKNFPKKGVNFVDVFSVIAENGVRVPFADEMDGLVFLPEARGFCFYGEFGLPIPIRREGKLPGSTITYYSESEYGLDTKQVMLDHIEDASKRWIRRNLRVEPRGSFKIPVYFFDDVLATGETALCFYRAMNGATLSFPGFDVTFEVKGFGFYTAVRELQGAERIEDLTGLNVKIAY